MLRGSAATRRLRRLFVVSALTAGVAVMHHVGTASPDADTAPPTAVVTAASHILADSGGGSTSAAADGPAHSRSTGPAAAAAAPVPAGHAADHGTAGWAHDLLHLCLAVVVSAALALLGRLLVQRGALLWIVARWTGVPCRPSMVRPPQVRPGRALLLSVCVMRT
jgi:hypothetical protein